MPKFMVISNKSQARLTTEVNKQLSKGWKLNGPLVAGPEIVTNTGHAMTGRNIRLSSVEYSQAMFKEDHDKPDKPDTPHTGPERCEACNCVLDLKTNLYRCTKCYYPRYTGEEYNVSRI